MTMQAEEFESLRIRRGEKGKLNLLSKDHCKYPLPGNKVKTTAHKVSVLLQVGLIPGVKIDDVRLHAASSAPAWPQWAGSLINRPPPTFHYVH